MAGLVEDPEMRGRSDYHRSRALEPESSDAPVSSGTDRESGAPASLPSEPVSGKQEALSPEEWRHVAEVLLMGGTAELTETWNKLRAASRGTIDLSKIDLRRCHLNDVDLRNVRLRYARLSQASLLGARFDGSDLTGADLSGAHLVGARFRAARLLMTNLADAKLQWADFAGADLRQANFKDASLEACRFAMTDASGVKLPREALEHISGMARHIENDALHPRSVFFILLGLCAFSMMTSLTASDLALITDSGAVRLPIIDTDVTVRAFFFTAPAVCLALQAYIAAHVRHLQRSVSELPTRFPDGTMIAETLSPWIQNALPFSIIRQPVREDSSDASTQTVSLARRLLVWGTRLAVPVTTLVMYLAFLRARDSVTVYWMWLVLAGSFCISYFSWSLKNPALDGWRTQRRAARVPWGFVATAGVAGIAACIPAIFFDSKAARVDARGEAVTGGVVQGALLAYSDFSMGDWHSAIVLDTSLPSSVFTRTDAHRVLARRLDMQHARLIETNLDGSDLSCIDWRYADLADNRFGASRLTLIDFRNAYLKNIDFSEARLDCIDLRGAVLDAVRLPPGAHVLCDKDTKPLDVSCGRDSTVDNGQCDSIMHQLASNSCPNAWQVECVRVMRSKECGDGNSSPVSHRVAYCPEHEDDLGESPSCPERG